MEKRVRVVIIVVVLIAILSAGFGFAAEGTRLKRSGTNRFGFCRYSDTPASAFATAAAVLLLIAQITVQAFAGCVCCISRAIASGGRSTAAWILLFLSWMSFLGAEFMLIVAALINSPAVHDALEDCSNTPAGWSACAAVVSLGSAFLGIGYYYLMVSLKQAADSS